MTRHTNNPILGHLARGLAAFALVLLTAASSRADDGVLGSSTSVNAFSGALTSAVPVAVPPYRGLEPQVALGYSSQSPNGFVGVGWALQAGSTIERMSPGRGAPKYTTADVYALDGNELVTCTTLGGTHCGKLQNYQRITWDSAANKWYVTTRDGTKATYSAVFTTTSGTFRWGLTETRDPKNNVVTYTWSCDGSPHKECYLDTIAYNGNTVKLWKEARTDYTTYATGVGLASMNYRLKSIQVKVGTSLARAYKLTYSYSSYTQRSMLASVQQCGKDATVDATGTVSGGTCLPAMSLSGHGGGNALALGWGNPDTGQASSSIDWLAGDRNGDGKTDLVQAYNAGEVMGFRLYDSTGCGYAYNSTYNTGYTADKVALLSGDVTGDGKADVVHAWNNNGSLAISLYGVEGAGTCYQTCWNTCYDTYGYPTQCEPYACNPYACASPYGKIWTTTNIGQSATNKKFLLADVTGDGKADLVQMTLSGNTVGFKVYKSNGTSFSYLWGTTSAAAPGAYQDAYSGDVNGDGKADIIESYANGIAVYLSSGTSLAYTAAFATGSVPTPLVRFAGDMNGDGKTDIFHVEDTGNMLSMRVYASNGKTYSLAYSTTTLGYSATSLALLPMDVNGDGRTDLLQIYEGSGYRVGFRVFTSRGTYYTYASGTANAGQGSVEVLRWIPGDMNGDGKTDLMLAWKNTGAASRLGLSAFKASGTLADLVGTFANGLGGSSSVTYAPSSEWPEPYLAEGQIFSTVKSVSSTDGRGDSQATNYSYRGARFDLANREFFGFRKATTTLAATGAYSETYYWQRVGAISKPEAIYKRTASGAILSCEKFVFQENSTPPYNSLTTQVWAFECNGNGSFNATTHAYISGCKRVLTTYEWDQYANMTRENQYGDYDVGGDERTAVRSFVPNLTKYIVGFPAYEEIHAGIGTGGTLLTRVKFYHDGATAETTAPSYGNLTKRLVWNDQTGGYVGSTYAYDTYGNRTAETDPWGKVTTRAMDATYRVYPITTTNAAGHVASRLYDFSIGRVTRATDANAGVTTTAYDALGRATLVTEPNGGQGKAEHLSYGTISATWSTGLQKVRRSKLMPNGVWASVDSYFDGIGRIYRSIDVLSGLATDTVYDVTGRVSKASRSYNSGSGSATQWDVYGYDELGRKKSVVAADGRTSSMTYDDRSRTVTDSLGKISTSYFDAYGRVTKLSETANGQTRNTLYRYDLLGRRTFIQDPANGQSITAYGTLGNLLQRSDPDQGLWTYEHDAYGRATAEIDARGQRVTMLYDNLGRLTRRTYPDATYDSYYFDEAGYGASKGVLTRTVSASGVQRKAYYDPMGRSTQTSTVVDGTTYTFKRGYDIAGRVVTITYPDNEVVPYTYGTSGAQGGRLTSVGTKVTNVSYNALGKVASMTYGNGVTSTYGYDTWNDQVTSIQFGSLATITYGYDAKRQMTSVSSTQLPLGSWTYGYDQWGRLTKGTNTSDATKTQTFLYDLAGRMTSQTGTGTYTYASAAHVHAATVIGGQTYAYDANGNLTSGGGRTLTYNYSHKAASIVSGGQTTTFVYDADGVRVKKSGASGTVIYVEGLYEKRGTAVTKYYSALGRRVAKSSAGVVTYLHSDHLGSTRLVSDASGAQVKRFDYSPFGTVIGESGTGAETSRFTGQEADDETGLLFYNSRYYDPRTALFLQVDSIIPNVNSPDDLDPYRYCYNNPVAYSDPSGHAPVVAIFAAIATYMAAHVAVAIACVVIGTALTFTNNPFLQTIGMVLAGIGSIGLSGPLLGLNAAQSMMAATAVALATSPISPLDPSVKKIIGWAYTAWGVATTINNMVKSAGAAADDGLTATDPPIDPNKPAAYKTEFRDANGKLVKVEYNIYAGEEALEKFGPQLNQATSSEIAAMKGLAASTVADDVNSAIAGIGMDQVIADIRTLQAGVNFEISLVAATKQSYLIFKINAGANLIVSGTVVGMKNGMQVFQATWQFGLNNALDAGTIVLFGKVNWSGFLDAGAIIGKGSGRFGIPGGG